MSSAAGAATGPPGLQGSQGLPGSQGAQGSARAHRRPLSITARITLLCVAVALVAAVLASFATARVLAAAERRDAGTAVASQPRTPAAVLRDAREVARRPLVVRSMLVSVTMGLLVGAAAGGGMSYVLTRPLRRTVDVARAMRSGRRDLRVPVEGPPELADVAVSLNELAGALELSESRQRAFLLSVSHELRTPLTAIRGFAESIADGVVTGPDAAQAGGVVLSESLRLERLVHDLLDLARLGAVDFALDLAPVDLGRLLDEAATVWRPRAAGRGVELRLERPGLTLIARTDAARVRQVIDGLAENAVRATPAGSPVVLALRGPWPGDPAWTLAVLQVRDGGPGLAADDFAVAFDSGVLGERYRNDRPGGVGIGLSLVRGLVRRLGGDVGVGVAAEGGACFTVWLRDATDPGSTA